MILTLLVVDLDNKKIYVLNLKFFFLIEIQLVGFDAEANGIFSKEVVDRPSS